MLAYFSGLSKLLEGGREGLHADLAADPVHFDHEMAELALAGHPVAGLGGRLERRAVLLSMRAPTASAPLRRRWAPTAGSPGRRTPIACSMSWDEADTVSLKRSGCCAGAASSFSTQGVEHGWVDRRRLLGAAPPWPA
jgi:hypothetical protein